MKERYDRFTESITEIYQSVQKIRMKEMKQFNLRSGHVSCMRLLLAAEEGLTSKELEEKSGMDKALVSRYMTQMKEMKFAFIEDAGGRSYKRKWMLTEAGRNAAEQIDVKIEEAVSVVGEGLSAQESEMLYVCLDKIQTNLKLYLKGE